MFGPYKRKLITLARNTRFATNLQDVCTVLSTLRFCGCQECYIVSFLSYKSLRQIMAANQSEQITSNIAVSTLVISQLIDICVYNMIEWI